MTHSRKIIKAVAISVVGLLPLSSVAEVTPKQVLDKIYGNFDRKKACWIAIDTEVDQRYCMKIDRADKINVDNKVRHYILAAGEAINDKGEPDGSHATPGMIGAFVIEENGNAATVLAADPKILFGENGNPPTQWHLVKIGPSDYWGWQNTTGGGNQGYFGSRYSILAPYGKKIRDLGGISASYSDEGACGDKRCERNSSSLESKIEIDSSNLNVKVFPLLITVSGRQSGKVLTPKTWSIPFDTTKWSYIKPAKWPFTGKDF